MFSYSNRPPRRKFFNDEPSLTKQAPAADCDINNLVRRMRPDGSVAGDFTSDRPPCRPQYGDFSDLPSYQEAFSTVVAAQDSFASLPALVRDRFANSPAKLLAFLDNPSNYEEAVKLGICSPRADIPPVIPPVEDGKV